MKTTTRKTMWRAAVFGIAVVVGATTGAGLVTVALTAAVLTWALT